MRLAAILSASLVALPSAALAGPVTAGINLGLSQSKLDGQSGLDPNRTLGLFGRLGFTPRVSGQLELSRIQTDDTGVDIRTGTASLVVDLGSRGHLVPTLIAGIGLASVDYGYYAEDSHHIEGGFGLEYRAEGGLTIGADVRMGGRTIDNEDQLLPVATGGLAEPDCAGGCGTGVAYYAPSGLREGEYRSARVTVGVRF